MVVRYFFFCYLSFHFTFLITAIVVRFVLFFLFFRLPDIELEYVSDAKNANLQLCFDGTGDVRGLVCEKKEGKNSAVMVNVGRRHCCSMVISVSVWMA